MTTKFSRRLQQAKDELGISNRKIRDIARQGGHSLSDYTVTEYLNGRHGEVRRSTIEALSYALRIPEDELAQLAGVPERRQHLRLDGELQEQADTLTRGQAAAVEEIIRQLASANRKAVTHDDSETPITPLFPTDRPVAAQEPDPDIDPEDNPYG